MYLIYLIKIFGSRQWTWCLPQSKPVFYHWAVCQFSSFFLILLWTFKTGSLSHAPQASLKLSVWMMLALKHWPPCLRLSTGIRQTVGSKPCREGRRKPSAEWLVSVDQTSGSLKPGKSLWAYLKYNTVWEKVSRQYQSNFRCTIKLEVWLHKNFYKVHVTHDHRKLHLTEGLVSLCSPSHLINMCIKGWGLLREK